jgi:hypothetical protein
LHYTYGTNGVLHYSVSTTRQELQTHRKLLLQAAHQEATVAVVANGLCNANHSKNSKAECQRQMLFGRLKTEITKDNCRSNVSNWKERSAVVSVHFVDKRSLSTKPI